MSLSDWDKNLALSNEISGLFAEIIIDDLVRVPITWGFTDKETGERKRQWLFKKFNKFDKGTFYSHFFSETDTGLLGSYFIDPDGNCKLGAVDIDGSKGTDDGEKDAHAVDQYEALVAVLRELGIRPLRTKSRSGTGYHVRVLNDRPTIASETRGLLVLACRVAGLPNKTEVFPKQDAKESHGSLLALPGSRWWCEEVAKKANRQDCGSWFLDDDDCPVPLEGWPALLRGADRLSPERLAKAKADLEAMWRAKNGSAPIDLGPVSRRYDGPTGNPSADAWAPADVEKFLTDGGFKSEYSAYASGHRWKLDHCAWTSEHTGEDPTGAAVFLGADGKLGHKCHHAHCDGRGWASFRQRVDPTWRRPQAPITIKPSKIYTRGKLVLDTVAGIFIAAGSLLPSSASAATQSDTRCTPATMSKIMVATIREECAEYWPAVPVPLSLSPEENREWGWKLVPYGKPRAVPRVREPGEDNEVEKALEAAVDRIRSSRKEFGKSVRLKRPTKDLLQHTARNEQDNAFSGRPWFGDLGTHKDGTPVVRTKRVLDDKEQKELDRALVGFQHMLTCCEMRRSMVGNLGTKKSVPDACGKTGTCPGCANCAARDMARYAAEAWGLEKVTVVTSRCGEFKPSKHDRIKRMREEADNICKRAEKGPRKPRKKKLKDGEVAPPEAPEPEKVVYARRYFEGLERAVIVGVPELHEAIGRKFQARGPKTSAGYEADAIFCAFTIESRVMTVEEAIKIIFGLDVSADGKVDEADNAAFASVWMEPAAELLHRNRALEEHLTGRLKAEMYDDEVWFKERDKLLTEVFTHPYVKAHKQKRHSANKPGKAVFAMPNPAEMRAWKRAKLLEEKPELALLPEEKFKVIALHHFGQLIWAVESWETKEPWECAKEIADARVAYLKSVGKDGFSLEAMAKKQAEFALVDPEDAYTTKVIHFKPAFGYDPATHGCREYGPPE